MKKNSALRLFVYRCCCLNGMEQLRKSVEQE